MNDKEIKDKIQAVKDPNKRLIQKPRCKAKLSRELNDLLRDLDESLFRHRIRNNLDL